MRKFILFAGLLASVTFIVATAYSGETITPESFTEKIILNPAITITIEQDNMEEALKELNILHGQMAEDGWVLFHLIEYIDDEDFEGFIVTYKSTTE